MYVDSSSTTINGKTYHRHLLRQSYRENGRVKHRTIANLSPCSREELEAIRLALRHKNELASLIEEQADCETSHDSTRDLTTRQGLSVGAVWLIYDLARQLGIEQAEDSALLSDFVLWHHVLTDVPPLIFDRSMNQLKLRIILPTM